MGANGINEVSTKSTAKAMACPVPPRRSPARLRGVARIVGTWAGLFCAFATCCALVGCAQGQPSGGQPAAETVETVEVVLPATQGGPKSFSSNDLDCTVTLKAFHPEGEGVIVYEYNLAISNPGSMLEEWSVDVPFSDDFSLVEGKRADYVVSGKVLTVSSKDYNALFPAGGELSDLTFQVKGPESLVVAS